MFYMKNIKDQKCVDFIQNFNATLKLSIIGCFAFYLTVSLLHRIKYNST